MIVYPQMWVCGPEDVSALVLRTEITPGPTFSQGTDKVWMSSSRKLRIPVLSTLETLLLLSAFDIRLSRKSGRPGSELLIFLTRMSLLMETSLELGRSGLSRGIGLLAQ
ncbi:MAG: hypothetical protein Q9198_010958, partial [Flavoplaca austrocitrina]